MPPYGKMFRTGETLLVYVTDAPSIFVRVELVKADQKKGWWQMTFLALVIPLKKITWILDDDQMRGSDFTMGGAPIRIERLVVPDDDLQEEPSQNDQTNEMKNQSEGGKIISMFGDND